MKIKWVNYSMHFHRIWVWIEEVYLARLGYMVINMDVLINWFWGHEVMEDTPSCGHFAYYISMSYKLQGHIPCVGLVTLSFTCPHHSSPPLWNYFSPFPSSFISASILFAKFYRSNSVAQFTKTCSNHENELEIINDPSNLHGGTIV